ncbi:MAG: hypothetical protein AAF721_37000 [Myxococcota bacterium]
MCSRFVALLLPVGVSAALAVAGCEASVLPEAGDPPTVERSEGPSAWVVSVGEDIADELVADPAFEDLVEVSAALMGDLREAQAALPDHDVDAIARTVTEPGFAEAAAEAMDPGTFLAHLGGNPEQLEEIQSLVEGLRARHGLGGAPVEDFAYVLELSLDTDAAQQMLSVAVADEIDLTPDWGPCEAVCYAAYLYALTIALAAFLALMAVAVLLFPWGIILAYFAIAWFTEAIAEAQALLELCLAECEGVADGLVLCGGTMVCGPDEYCWTGVLGIGADECRPKKDPGDTCANAAQCHSGCCKLHLPTHPVSKVCRPANRCN